MKKHLSLFLLLALLGWAQSSFAVVYQWRAGSLLNNYYSTPDAACAAYPVPTGSYIFTYAGIKFNTGSVTQGYCQYKATDKYTGAVVGTSNYGQISFGRSGTECAAGSIYNSDNGACEVSQCKAKEGRYATFASSAALPGAACIGGCAAALPQQHRYTNPKTGSTTYYYEGNYTGNDCSGANPAGYTECNLEQDCTKDLSAPEVDKSNECEAQADEVDSSGRTWKVSKCTDTEISQQQQDDNCNWGTVGAGSEANWTCVTKPGKTNEKKTETATKTTTNPDGSKDTKQTITTTETKCTGANSCTTTTTTTTNTNHTNADGSPGNSSSSCKGTACPTTDGDKGEGEEDGDDGIAGPTKALTGKVSEAFGDEEAQWQAKIDAGRQQLDGLISQYSSLFSGVFDLNIGTGGAKLPCYDIPIRTPQINTNLDFCPAKFEDQLVYLKYILLACAAILAGFIILRD